MSRYRASAMQGNIPSIIISWLLFASGCISFTVSQTDDAGVLANAIFSGPGITVLQATFSGASIAVGTFADGPFGIGSGAILTTGAAEGALPGGDHYVDNGAPGSSMYCSANSFNAAILTVDILVEPGYAGILVEFIFASEEQGGSPDPMGILLDGTNYALDENGDRFTATSGLLGEPVVIVPPDSVTSYPGSSPPLEFIIPVSVGPHTIIFSICDENDSEWDSALLIKASGSTESTRPLQIDYVTTTTTVLPPTTTGTETIKASGTVSGTFIVAVHAATVSTTTTTASEISTTTESTGTATATVTSEMSSSTTSSYSETSTTASFTETSAAPTDTQTSKASSTTSLSTSGGSSGTISDLTTDLPISTVSDDGLPVTTLSDTFTLGPPDISTIIVTTTLQVATMTSTVTFTTLDPNGPPFLVVTVALVTIEYHPCSCINNGIPPIEMTTTRVPCQECEAIGNGEDEVTLTVPKIGLCTPAAISGRSPTLEPWLQYASDSYPDGSHPSLPVKTKVYKFQAPQPSHASIAALEEPSKAGHDTPIATAGRENNDGKAIHKVTETPAAEATSPVIVASGSRNSIKDLAVFLSIIIGHVILM